MIIISLVFAILANKTKSKIRKIIYYIGICIPFIIVSGIRYDVGTDYMFRYVPNYISISEGKKCNKPRAYIFIDYKDMSNFFKRLCTTIYCYIDYNYYSNYDFNI